MKSVGLNLTEPWKTNKSLPGKKSFQKKCFLLFHNQISQIQPLKQHLCYLTALKNKVWALMITLLKIIQDLKALEPDWPLLLRLWRRIHIQTLLVVGGTQPTGENCLPCQGFIFFKATGCLNYLKAMFVVLIQFFKFWLEGISKTEVECFSLVSLSLTSFTFKSRVF